jgi:hypothetical protein
VRLSLPAVFEIGIAWNRRLLAYLTTDREQATVLFAVAGGALLLRWMAPADADRGPGREPA